MQTDQALALCGLILLSLWLSIQSVPIAKDLPEHKSEKDFEQVNRLHYNHYLKEVVDYLEKDPHFQMHLSNMSLEDIKQGKIAKELDFVGHNVRYQLDELKRQEMNRLRTLIKVKHDILQEGDAQAINHQALLKQFEHLDHENPHTFEIKDLDRLIQTTNHDLENYDEQHHKDFKRYEMMKEHERREHLKTMDEEHRKKEEVHYEEMKRKHAEHPKINHPGSEDQLKEVWKETDGLDEEAFNPKTFFKLHDSNGDDYLDEQELEALFNQELQKMYNPNNEEDDMLEMEEERLKMREHVMTEMDTDKDRLLSIDEFLVGVQKKTDNTEWQTLEQTPIYTEEELKEYEESLVKEHDELVVKTDELQKKKEELQKHQQELDAQKLELQQAVEHFEKLKTGTQTPAGI